MAKSKREEPRLSSPKVVDFVRAGAKSKPEPEDLKKCTLYLPVDFHKKAKAWGAEHSMSLSAMAVEGIRIVMADKK